MSDTKKEELTVKENVTTYLKGVRAEWDKITWPEKKQVGVETIIVLVVVFFFTLLVYVYDVLFEFVFGLIPGG